MTVWSKVREWVRPTKVAAPSADPLAKVDDVLADMRATLDEARKVLATAAGPDRDKLEAGVRELERSVDATSRKREELLARKTRINEVTELTAEMRAVNEELLALPIEERDGDRGRELRARSAVLRGRAEMLQRKS